jgi:hypothetical protein
MVMAGFGLIVGGDVIAADAEAVELGALERLQRC